MSHLLASTLNHHKQINDGEKVTTAGSPLVFQSNLSCVLNDPKKTRAEVSTFFTKTWGNSFVDRPPDRLSRLSDYNFNDFESYFHSLRQSEKYGRPRLKQQTTNETNNSQKTNPIINIPQLFLSSQFTLSDSSTFNLVFPGIVPFHRSLSPTNTEQQKSRTTSVSSDKSESNNRRQSTSNGTLITNSTTNSTTKHSINSATRLLQDKYSHYLDEIELLITRALATKSDCFHDAVRSHDDIQLFLNTTRHAISSLRSQLSNYDSQSLLKLLQLYRLIRQRKNEKELLQRLESLSIVKQTHVQVQNLLATSDYLSALDLIDATREIISTQLTDIVCLRFYHTQLDEHYSLIVSLMRQEFGQVLNNYLTIQEDLSLSNEYVDDDKLLTILIGLIRVKDDKYFEEIRSKFEQFLFDIVDRNISSFTKENYAEKSIRSGQKTNNELLTSNEDSSSALNRTIYPPSLNSNSTSINLWIRLMNLLLTSTFDGIARLKNISQTINEILLKHEQIQTSSFDSLLNHIYDTIQDRLTIIFNQESTRYQINLERLSLDEYSQMVKLIENFILNLNKSDEKYKSRPLKAFLQSQTSKFLNHFHDERKERIAKILDDEQWKQAPIPRAIQNSIDDLFHLTATATDLTGSDLLTIDNEQFVLTNSSLNLIMLIIDYCSCAQLLSSSSINDVEHRLIELLKLFNSKTCQLVLGAGAVRLGRIRTITAKILAITCRCLQFVKIILPKIKIRFQQLQNSNDSSSKISSLSSNKQFEQLTRLYSEHIDEIHGKLISIVESAFEETLATYEVRAPMPSDCFRTLIGRHITTFYNAVARIVSPADLILLFTRLNSIFKRLLSKRLRQLRIANDGGPQHGLLTSDLLYYIKQIQNFSGLEMLELHVDEIWTIN